MFITEQSLHRESQHQHDLFVRSVCGDFCLELIFSSSIDTFDFFSKRFKLKCNMADVVITKSANSRLFTNCKKNAKTLVSFCFPRKKKFACRFLAFLLNLLAKCREKKIQDFQAEIFAIASKSYGFHFLDKKQSEKPQRRVLNFEIVSQHFSANTL